VEGDIPVWDMTMVFMGIKHLALPMKGTTTSVLHVLIVNN